MELAFAMRILVLCVCAIGADAQPTPLAEFPFDPDLGVIVVPILRGDQVLPCVVDSATTGTILDAAFKPSLGTPVRARIVRTPHGAMEVEEFRLPPLRLGSVVLPESLGVCTDLTPLRQALHVEVSGIVGMSILGRFVVQLDFDANVARFWEASCVPSPAWGMPLHIGIGAGGIPRIVAAVGDCLPTDFVVDTGNSGAGDLEGSQFQAYRSAGHLRTHGGIAVVSTVRGRSPADQGVLDRFSIGVFEQRDLEFTAGDCNRIGMQSLQRFIVTFDFPHNVMYLRPRSGTHSSPEPMGMHANWLDDQLTILAIDPASRAEAAELKVGDVIVSIQGQPASGLNVGSMKRLLRRNSSLPVAMQLRRGLKELQIVVSPDESRSQAQSSCN